MAQSYIPEEEAIRKIAEEIFEVEHGEPFSEDHPEAPRALLEASKMYVAFNTMRWLEEKS